MLVSIPRVRVSVCKQARRHARSFQVLVRSHRVCCSVCSIVCIHNDLRTHTHAHPARTLDAAGAPTTTAPRGCGPGPDDADGARRPDKGAARRVARRRWCACALCRDGRAARRPRDARACGADSCAPRQNHTREQRRDLVRKKESFARRKRDQMQRGLAWRKVESCFMDMEIAWQHQDQARHVVWQRYLQLSQLAEVCYTRTHAHTHTYTHARTSTHAYV